MKKYINVTLAIKVESEQDINIDDLYFNDALFPYNNAEIKVVDVHECYEVEV